MKTNFLKTAADTIKRTGTSSRYLLGENFAIGLKRLIDETRNQNGERCVICVQDYAIDTVPGRICIDLFFTHDASDEVETICLPINDFQKWCVWNGIVIWYQQQKGLLAWKHTIQEEVDTPQVQQYLQDICMSMTAYKQAEFMVKDYAEGELYGKEIE